MKPRFDFTVLAVKRVLVRIGFSVGAFLMGVVPAFSQDYPPGKLRVTFWPGAFDSLETDTNGNRVYQISYLDSVNLANVCSTIVSDSVAGLDSLRYNYLAYFPDSADLLAIADAYLSDPSVRFAAPDYYIEFLFTPNDSLFDRQGNSVECRQWGLDSTHCQFEKAWDITRGDTSVVIAMVDIGILYSHPDLAGNLWINGPEDINNPGTFEPWPSTQQIGGKYGDLDTIDQDGDGFVDDVIGYHFTGYYFYGDTCTICSNCRSCPDTLSPTDIPLEDRYPCPDPDDPCTPGGGGGCTGCRLIIRNVDSVVVRSSPVVDSLGRVPVTLGSVIIPHGTWVSSVAAAATNNSQGAAGAAPPAALW